MFYFQAFNIFCYMLKIIFKCFCFKYTLGFKIELRNFPVCCISFLVDLVFLQIRLYNKLFEAYCIFAIIQTSSYVHHIVELILHKSINECSFVIEGIECVLSPVQIRVSNHLCLCISFLSQLLSYPLV